MESSSPKLKKCLIIFLKKNSRISGEHLQSPKLKKVSCIFLIFLKSYCF